MNTSFNAKHFTYHIGTSSELNSVTTICYYARKNITGSGEISITSLDTFYDRLMSQYQDKGVSKSTRVTTDDEDYFPITSESGLIEFDTIIYIGDSNTPIGYTYFSEVQTNYDGSSRIGNMKLSFYFHMNSTIVDFNTTFTLTPIWNIETPELTDLFHTSKADIDKYYEGQTEETSYLRYTDDLSQLASGSDSFCDITDSGVLTRDTSYKYWIPPVKLDTLVDYTFYNVGFSDTKVVLYRWNSLGYYTMDSLTEYNHFGILKNLYKGQVTLGEGEEIYTMVDNMIILTITEDSEVYPRSGFIDVTSGRKYIDTTKRIINDPWDSKNNISIIGATKMSSDLSLRFLSVLPGTYYYLLEKFDSWYVFLNSKVSTKAWCSMYGIAYFSSSDTIIPLSDRTLMRLSNSSIDFYLFDGNTQFNESSQPSYSISYTYGNTSDTDLSLDILTPAELIDGIRRRPLPSLDLRFLRNSPVSFKGIIFYLDDDNIIQTL